MWNVLDVDAIGECNYARVVWIILMILKCVHRVYYRGVCRKLCCYARIMIIIENINIVIIVGTCGLRIQIVTFLVIGKLIFI